MSKVTKSAAHDAFWRNTKKPEKATAAQRDAKWAAISEETKLAIQALLLETLRLVRIAKTLPQDSPTYELDLEIAKTEAALAVKAAQKMMDDNDLPKEARQRLLSALIARQSRE